MKIAFLGTSKYSKVYRDALQEDGYEILDGLDKLSEADLGIVAYYGKLLPKNILDTPKRGFINVHYSLLPRWRGPSPIQSAILAGDDKVGITILKIIPKADAGDIIAQKELPIGPNETYFEIERKLDEIGPRLLTETLPLWTEGKIVPQKQDDSKVTIAKLFNTEDGKIDWGKSVEIISRKIRALNPNPGTFTFFDGKRLLISRTSIEKKNHLLKFGEVVLDGNETKIAAADGFVIPTSIKLEGKKETTASDFIHGHNDFVGSILN